MDILFMSIGIGVIVAGIMSMFKNIDDSIKAIDARAKRDTVYLTDRLDKLTERIYQAEQALHYVNAMRAKARMDELRAELRDILPDPDEP